MIAIKVLKGTLEELESQINYLTGSQSFVQFYSINTTFDSQPGKYISVVTYQKARKFSTHKTQEEYDNQRK